VNVKKSKLQRKYVRAMDQMADVPRPARRFKYPPTFGNRRLRATFKPVRVGGPSSMPPKRRTPDSRRAFAARQHVLYAPDKRQRLEPKRSILSRIFSRRKV
jgi:hypothetical protein